MATFSVLAVILWLLCHACAASPALQDVGDSSESISVAAIRNPNYANPDGLSEYARALSKWGSTLPDGLAEHISNKGLGEFVWLSLLSFRSREGVCQSVCAGICVCRRRQVLVGRLENALSRFTRAQHTLEGG
jgi:hypothetical protein